MNLRKSIKYYFYSYCPFLRGKFPYFGSLVYFPKGSHLFLEACKQGIFENEIVDLIESLITPESYYFDIGGNIGLMSLPFLKRIPNCKIVTFEPSPNSLPYLNRTHQHSNYHNRWKICPKALSDYIGTNSFSISSEAMSPFDGLKDTNRGGASFSVEVAVSTLDAEWEKLGRPFVSVIKCDVEGGELKVFEGARNCILKNRPVIITEWNSTNLLAHNCPVRSLFDFSKSMNYGIYAVPGFDRIADTNQLELKVKHVTENFILIPIKN